MWFSITLVRPSPAALCNGVQNHGLRHMFTNKWCRTHVPGKCMVKTNKKKMVLTFRPDLRRDRRRRSKRKNGVFRSGFFDQKKKLSYLRRERSSRIYIFYSRARFSREFSTPMVIIIITGWLFSPPVGYFLIYPTTWISRQKTRLVTVHA